MTLIKWFVLAVSSFIMSVVCILLSPVIAAFVDRTSHELPRWLAWFQTTDSDMKGCWGDAEFCTAHRNASDWPTYIKWLIRNPAAGYSDAVCGVDATQTGKLVLRLFGAGRVVGYTVRGENGHFECTGHIRWTAGKITEWRIGWKLGNIIADPSRRAPIVHRIRPWVSR